ncbi:entericidin A/B family lipoprotein [Geminicoccus harenae]|uniref:entericidin A/B family lipoprotein n=1 Tax=Geminicoccus harenae TaxID=2498453 RepID=UPI00168A6675|nr:entericidin A/B family lipoprotein [Geminicoccus harenae]
MSNAVTSLTAGTRLLRVLAALALLFSVGTLSACNMMEGAGEDISAGGDALDDAAEDARD